jgi:hypothetical protein
MSGPSPDCKQIVADEAVCAAPHSAHIWARPAIGHGKQLRLHPDLWIYNNLHPPCDGMPAALSHAVRLRKTRRKRLNDVVCRVEITDAACRI